MRKEVTILVAEDDNGHFALTKKVLQRAGIENEIIWFTDGQETLEFLLDDDTIEAKNNGRKYLLLLDIRMPGISGVEVLEKIKNNAQLSDIPVIMVTTSSDQNIAEHCYSLGCESHVVKPVGDLLVKTVKRVGGVL